MRVGLVGMMSAAIYGVVVDIINGISNAWQDESGGVMTDESGNPIIFL